MNRNNFLAFLLVLSFGQNINAQNEGVEYFSQNREISLDIKPLLLRRDNFPTTIPVVSYKKRKNSNNHLDDSDSKWMRYSLNVLLRGSIGLNTENRNDVLSDAQEKELEDVLQAEKSGHYFITTLRVGLEHRKQFSRFQVYYGADALLEFNSSIIKDHDFKLVTNDDGQQIGKHVLTKSQTIRPKTGVLGIMGLRYFFHPKVSISIESSLWFTLGYYMNIDADIDIQSNEVFINERKTRLLRVEIVPRYVDMVNLSYYF